MRKVLSAVACLLICGSVWADEPKKTIVDVKVAPNVNVKVVPKVGVVTPSPRPRPGNYYWRHPTYGYGYWYYPAPVAAPVNYYIDEFGRVVPNGYAYDGNGQLVPIPAAPVVVPAPVYTYPSYPYYYGRWGRWGWR